MLKGIPAILNTMLAHHQYPGNRCEDCLMFFHQCSLIHLESLFLWSFLMYDVLVTMIHILIYFLCITHMRSHWCWIWSWISQLESPGVMFWGSGVSFGVGRGLWHWKEWADGREWRTQRKDTQKWIEAGVFSSLFWKSLPVWVCHTPECECVSVGGGCGGVAW